jgi:four helix bundle protein
MTSAELQERLITFAASIIELCNQINNSRAGVTLIDQMNRSSISSALNYGEASGAESAKDFIHKMQVVLKELRETWVALRIVEKSKLHSNEILFDNVFDECNQLISIFTKSVTTNKSKLLNNKS